MAKVRTVRLTETPYWADNSEFRAKDGVVDLQREGSDIHIRFLSGRHADTLKHVVVPMTSVHYYLPDDEPAPERKK